MAKLQFSTKQVAINKAQTQAMITVAVASFVTIFCLVFAQSLWSQGAYLQKVISKKQKADNQLKSNLGTVNQLADAYKAFVSTPQNVLGGNPTGTGPQDGDNAQIVLDALPYQYDFPALTASIEKILTNESVSISAIGGTDAELSQQSNSKSSTPEPVQMPFSFSIDKADYGSTQKVIDALDKSIRPMAIDNLAITGGGSNMQITVNAHTYYQPAKDLQIRTEVVK